MVIYSSPRLCLIGESIPLAIDEIRCQLYPRRTKNSWSERHGHIYIIPVLSNKQIWEPISRYLFTTVYYVYSILLIICMPKKRVQLIRTKQRHHRYNDVTMSAMASEITSLTIVYSTVYSGAEKENIKALCHWLLWGEFTGHKVPVTRKMFPFGDVIMMDVQGRALCLFNTPFK